MVFDAPLSDKEIARRRGTAIALITAIILIVKFKNIAEWLFSMYGLN